MRRLTPQPQLFWPFLLAYGCSGLAGLIYEVSWTRLLTLYMGHTTAAASTVVAAFMGGLAAGATVGGRIAPGLTRRRCLRLYIGLEAFVAVVALLLPLELLVVTPLLAAAYQGGGSHLAFPAVRLVSCLVMMFVPAAALGATFPVAVRWYVRDPERAGRAGGALYAVNTAGAAVGAFVAGFVLMPRIGVAWTTRVGVLASLVAIGFVVLIARSGDEDESAVDQAAVGRASESSVGRPSQGESSVGRPFQGRRSGRPKRAALHPSPTVDHRWLAAIALGLTGFASLVYEITWTRVLSVILGPTIYAFSATLAVVIGGAACGSAIGAWLAGRTRRPAAWLSVILAASAVVASWSGSIAGSDVPRWVADQVARSPEAFDQLLTKGGALIALLVLPASAGLGAAFPLAFGMLGHSQQTARRLGVIYAINTLGAVAGSLLAGFVFIPRFGLQPTLALVSGVLVLATLIILVWGQLAAAARITGFIGATASLVILGLSPPWDRELLASGVYIYAPYAPQGVDLASVLKAGTLLYYKEGAAATVSVKRLTGTTSLAIDGKVDASSRSDMLTQKVVAHLPLLLHDHPRRICIIGLGSGVTLGSALRHPIDEAEVVELSPEVVEASHFFAEQNHSGLADPRARLILGDGRSHLLLTEKQYDVIISEPSNPWIAGVASLFTREFFTTARDHLTPGGIMCQWAHTYNIGDRDLRSIVATFASVFPNASAWLVGEEDVLLVGSTLPIDDRLDNVTTGWARPGVAQDLAEVGAQDPFAMYSFFVGGTAELRRYADGAPVLTDDRSTLEFSAPRELHNQRAGENAAAFRALLARNEGPAPIRRAIASASADEWRRHAAMMFRSDMFQTAFEDHLHALDQEPDGTARAAGLDEFVQAAILSGHVPDALDRVKKIVAADPRASAAMLAQSKLLQAGGSKSEAIEAARNAGRVDPQSPAPLEQLAAIYADSNDLAGLDTTVDNLRRVAPDRAATLYYGAVSAFLHDRFSDASALAERAVKADPSYAAVYDLLGSAYTKTGNRDLARKAFASSLEFNPHDSSAYTNLALLSLSAGDSADAARQFAEALWLDPRSDAARQGLEQARIRASE